MLTFASYLINRDLQPIFRVACLVYSESKQFYQWHRSINANAQCKWTLRIDSQTGYHRRGSHESNMS